MTRTPPPPVILPEFSAALLVAAAGGAHHAYDMSPGEGRCSQYIHSPAPLSLSQYGQPGGEGVGQEQLGAGLHLHHVPPNQANSPSALCAGPQAHGADEPEEKAAQPLRPALFPIFLVRFPPQCASNSPTSADSLPPSLRVAQGLPQAAPCATRGERVQRGVQRAGELVG